MSTSAALGRSGVPGLRLNTTLISDEELQADLPTEYVGQANDLFVAVLAADGLSVPLAMTAAMPDLSLSVAEWYEERAEDEEAPPPMSTSVSTDLVWNVPDQEISIDGVGLTSAPQVVFRTQAENFSAVVQQVATPDGLPGSISRWAAIVPSAVVAHPLFSVIARVAQGAQQQAMPSGRGCVQVVTPLRIPLGGLARFVAYADSSSAPPRPMVIREDGRHVRQIRPAAGPAAGSLAEVAATFSLVENPAKPLGVTVVQEEQNPADAYYLRALGFTHDVGLAKMRVTYEGSRPITRDIAVGRGALGTPVQYLALHKQHVARSGSFPTFDDMILDVADEYGLPPQYLKAQALRETGGYRWNFRYEALTRDHSFMTGDGPSARPQARRRAGSRHRRSISTRLAVRCCARQRRFTGTSRQWQQWFGIIQQWNPNDPPYQAGGEIQQNVSNCEPQ